MLKARAATSATTGTWAMTESQSHGPRVGYLGLGVEAFLSRPAQGRADRWRRWTSRGARRMWRNQHCPSCVTFVERGDEHGDCRAH